MYNINIDINIDINIEYLLILILKLILIYSLVCSYVHVMYFTLTCRSYCFTQLSSYKFVFTIIIVQVDVCGWNGENKSSRSMAEYVNLFLKVHASLYFINHYVRLTSLTFARFRSSPITSLFINH